MPNFIAIILCTIAAILHGYQGNIGWLAVMVGLIIANLPFAITWFTTIF